MMALFHLTAEVWEVSPLVCSSPRAAAGILYLCVMGGLGDGEEGSGAAGGLRLC